MDMADNFQAKEMDKLNPSIVTALGYTIRVLGIPSYGTEKELAVHFTVATDVAVDKVHLADTSMKEINLYFKGGTLMQRQYDC
eukprot:12166269-Ditylum_brightwellii.AAC.1